MDQLTVTLEASVVARNLEHDKIVVQEHDTKSLPLIIVASGNIHFVSATCLCGLSMPTTTCSGFALKKERKKEMRSEGGGA